MLRIVTSEETKIEVVLKQRNTERDMKVAVWAEAGEPFVKRITIHPLGEGGGVQIDTLEFRNVNLTAVFRGASQEDSENTTSRTYVLTIIPLNEKHEAHPRSRRIPLSSDVTADYNALDCYRTT